MNFLFKSDEDSLKSALSKITEDQIQDACTLTILERGEDYYSEGAVEEIHFESDNTLRATISGHQDYTVFIMQENHMIKGRCSCPYDGGDVCKHIVCTLFFAFHEYEHIPVVMSDQTSKTDGSASNEFRIFLDTRSKEELIDLLEKYAPKSYKQQVRNTFLSEPEADKLLFKVSAAIDKLFEDEDLLYSPADFEEAVVDKLEQLRGIWGKKPDAVAHLLLNTLSEIDHLQNDGYLYTENYESGWGNEECFEGDSFMYYVLDFIKQLPIEKRLDFTRNLYQLTERLSYDNAISGINYYRDKLFSEEELPHLKNYYIELVTNGTSYNDMVFYNQLSSLFTDEENELVLGKISGTSAKLTIVFARFLEGRNRTPEALDTLNSFITINSERHACPEDIFILRLQFGLKQKENPDELFMVAIQALTIHANHNMLTTLVNLLPEFKDSFELFLKSKYPDQIFKYYESTNRLDEAVALIRAKKISDWDSYPFWCRHKKQFKQDAQEAFESRLEKNLVEAKDSAYEIVTETLIQLRQIAPDVSAEWLREIKIKYWRRKNLMYRIQKL